MDFAFTEEQDMLRSSAREFLADRYPPDRVAAIADGEGFDRSEWKALADMGWIGISIPEQAGGAGLSFIEEVILSEEMGRALYPGPWFSAAILGMGAFRLAGDADIVSKTIAGDRIPTLAWAGEDGRFGLDPAPKVQWDETSERLVAAKFFVPDVGVADLLLVLGSHAEGIGIWAVDRDAEGVSWREVPTVDSTRRMGEVTLHVRVWLSATGSPAMFFNLRDRALAALAAEAVGVGSAALDMAVAHVRERHQFGRPIGSFQAVSHQLAQSFLELEAARSLAYWAAWAVSEGVPEAVPAAAAAKARASEAAVAACERAIQVHGGMGFTWEHALHRWYKRALGLSAFMGWGSEHRARVAAHLLD